MPINITTQDWQVIYEALYDYLEAFNVDDSGFTCSLSVQVVDNEETRRILPVAKKVEALLAARGVEVEFPL